MKFRYILLFSLLSTIIHAQNALVAEFYRHLKYNHVSPYLDIQGIHPIDSIEANNTSHYIFRKDNRGRIVEIFNHHYHTEKKHPLASIGAYRTHIDYRSNEEIRRFYDPNDMPVTNDRGVYVEKYIYDNDGNKEQLIFFDIDNVPMLSNWNIHRYVWNRVDSMIVEKRYNLYDEEVSLSPYFLFGTTGIVIDDINNRLSNYNLDSTYRVIDNKDGVAAYQDQFDSLGNHVSYSYYDSQGRYRLNQWGYSIGKKYFDNEGNHVKLDYLDDSLNVLRSLPVYTNTNVVLFGMATSEDSIDIRRVSLNYLIALQRLDPTLMNEIMSDSLNKMTLGYDRLLRKQVPKRTTRQQMMNYAKTWNKSGAMFPPNPSNEVEILDIYDRMASVRLVSDNWVEYLHLLKIDGQWEIQNLLWQHKDIRRYRDD